VFFFRSGALGLHGSDPPRTTSKVLYSYGYGYEQIPDYGHLPPRFVPRVVRAEWAWIPTSRAAATDALVVC
jgi:hypothetical protein